MSLEQKVSIYEAFHDRNTLPIQICMLCYRKCSLDGMGEISWSTWTAWPRVKRARSPYECRLCFPVEKAISGCKECVGHFRKSSLTPAAQLHSRLGCEHMFPDELKDLTPVEEKLIALNSCHGFITRYSIPDGQRQTVNYPRHIKDPYHGVSEQCAGACCEGSSTSPFEGNGRRPCFMAWRD